ncbi:hypothetical protein Tco_0228414 [Tanacetum coccineum]
MPTTTVAPKKRANNIRNKTRNDKVSAFNLGKAGIDLNSLVEDLVYMGSRDTDVYISLHNVDPNKVVRKQYVDCMSFLGSSEPVFLDCEAIDEEAILEEQILALMHRFADRFMDRRVEINNLMVLHDHPLIDYGKYVLGCMTGADMKK